MATAYNSNRTTEKTYTVRLLWLSFKIVSSDLAMPFTKSSNFDVLKTSKSKSPNFARVTKPKLIKIRKVKRKKASSNNGKKVRFCKPLNVNQKKSVSEYSVTELMDIYQRFVHMEMVDDKQKRGEMSLHRVFKVLFDCNEKWMDSYLEARKNE